MITDSKRLQPALPILAMTVALALVSGCERPFAEPARSESKTDDPELQLYAVSSDRQTVVINQPLPEPLIVRVTVDGAPATNTPVLFRYPRRSGKMVEQRTDTDVNGNAQAIITPDHFGHWPVTARLAEQPNGPRIEFRFNVTGWVSTIAGDGIQGFGGDGGPAIQCQMNAPFGIVQDDDDNIIFVDWYNNRIRKIDQRTGLIDTVAGQGSFRSDGDGGPALEANMNGPYALKSDAKGNLFVSDYFSGRIRKIDVRTGIITTVAGNGKHDNNGDDGPAIKAAIDVPLDIAVDPAGNIFVSDWRRSVIRRVSAKSGRITTFAGDRKQKRGHGGDNGPATSARLNQPLGLATDAAGNLYITDYANHRIRKVAADSGIITTVAGNGAKGFGGDDGPATEASLRYPHNVAVDSAGNLFIADAENHRIRMVHADSGIITTIAGNGSQGFAGDGEWATKASFSGLFSLAVTRGGELLVADYFNNRIRKIGFSKPNPTTLESNDRQLIRQARQIFGMLPSAPNGDDSQISERRAVLGRLLFHERLLSKDKDISCRTCHDLERYGIDGRTRAMGHRKQVGTRNAPSVFNAALQEALFWDGRAPTVEAQARMPIFNPVELAMESEAELIRRLQAVPEYPPLFRTAFPGQQSPINLENITRAIGAFERRLLTPGPFDDFMRGEASALSPEQKDGLRIFLREGCASCHFGPLLGGIKLGLRKPYPNKDHGLDFEFRKYFGDEYFFKVPQLRNIAETGPYLHDGSAKFLKDAIFSRRKAYRYGESLTKIDVTLAAGEIEKLTAFMRSLTGRIDRRMAAIPDALSDGH